MSFLTSLGCLFKVHVVFLFSTGVSFSVCLGFLLKFLFKFLLKFLFVVLSTFFAGLI